MTQVCDERCELAHLVNNQLSIIMATCELLLRHANNPEVVAGLRMILKAAWVMGDEFNKPRSQGQGA